MTKAQIIVVGQDAKTNDTALMITKAVTDINKTGKRCLLLLRGLPGSGKTYMAQAVNTLGHIRVYEANDHFYNDHGVFEYDNSKLTQAHRLCQLKAELELTGGRNAMVANTSVTKWEVGIYEKIANRANADLLIVNMKGFYKNIHNVPEHILEKMRKNWVDTP